MGWCSFVLLLMIATHLGTLTPTPRDQLKFKKNLNNSPTDPPSQERGRQTDKKRKRILGGTRYYPNGLFCADYWPVPDWEHWTASIKIRYTKSVPPRVSDFSACGGVLVTNQHILTALHCITDRSESQVILNYDDVEIFFDYEHVELLRGKIKFKPTRFNYMRWPARTAEVIGKGKDPPIKDDIVLIKLNDTVPNPLRPIPRSRNDGIDTVKNTDGSNNFWFAGWGVMSPTRPMMSPFLLYTNKLESMPCPNNRFIQDEHLCFESTNDAAACVGDSGSPGVVGVHHTTSSKPVWHLQSIDVRARTLRGVNCSDLQPGSHSVHIDVHKYEKEINYWMKLP